MSYYSRNDEVLNHVPLVAIYAATAQGEDRAAAYCRQEHSSSLETDVSLLLDDKPGYALRRLSLHPQDEPVLVVTANRSLHYLLDLLDKGPEGLLVTPNLPRNLAFYLSRVAAGEHFYEGPPPNKTPFTPKEREVLRRSVYGESVEALAQSLGITPYTAGEHLRHIREKLGAERDTELVLAYFAGDTARLAV